MILIRSLSLKFLASVKGYFGAKKSACHLPLHAKILHEQYAPYLIVKKFCQVTSKQFEYYFAKAISRENIQDTVELNSHILATNIDLSIPWYITWGRLTCKG